MTRAILATFLPFASIATVFACSVDLDREGGTLLIEVRGVDARFGALELNVDGPDVSFSRMLAVRTQDFRLAVLSGSVRVRLAGRDPSGTVIRTAERDVDVAVGAEAVIQLDLAGAQPVRRVRCRATERLVGEVMDADLVATSSTVVRVAVEVDDARAALGAVRLVGFEHVAGMVPEDDEIIDLRDIVSPPVHLEFVGERVGAHRLATWTTLGMDPIEHPLALAPATLDLLQEDLQEGRFMWVLRGTVRVAFNDDKIALAVDYYIE